jgi:hypothetical protein
MRASADGPAITVGGDARVTRLAHSCRRFKIDELPQLFNVLKGEMNSSGRGRKCPIRRPVSGRAARHHPVGAAGHHRLASLTYIDESQLLATAGPERYYAEFLMPAKLSLAEAYVRGRNSVAGPAILAATATGILGWRWIPSPLRSRRIMSASDREWRPASHRVCFNSASGEYTGRLRVVEPCVPAASTSLSCCRRKTTIRLTIPGTGVEVHQYSMDRGNPSLWGDAVSIRELVRLFRAERFDILHSFGHKANFCMGLAAIRLRSPVASCM